MKKYKIEIDLQDWIKEKDLDKIIKSLLDNGFKNVNFEAVVKAIE